MQKVYEKEDNALRKQEEEKVRKIQFSQAPTEAKGEEEEPAYISFFWSLSFLLLIGADILDLFVGLLGIITVGLFSFLKAIPTLFAVPGAFFFVIIILYYITHKYISPYEGAFYITLISLEFFGFVPFVGSIITIFPLNTIAPLTSRVRLWRIRRLREIKKKIRG